MKIQTASTILFGLLLALPARADSAEWSILGSMKWNENGIHMYTTSNSDYHRVEIAPHVSCELFTVQESDRGDTQRDMRCTIDDPASFASRIVKTSVTCLPSDSKRTSEPVKIADRFFLRLSCSN